MCQLFSLKSTGAKRHILKVDGVPGTHGTRANGEPALFLRLDNGRTKEVNPVIESFLHFFVMGHLPKQTVLVNPLF